MFKDVVQTFIVQLYDLKNKSISGEKVESTLLKISRYVSLKPNLFGIGIDFNAILEDIGSRSKK